MLKLPKIYAKKLVVGFKPCFKNRKHEYISKTESMNTDILKY